MTPKAPKAPLIAPLQVTAAMIRAMRQGEADRKWLAQHADVLASYRGDWVVVHQGRIVAHSPDGAEVARAAPAARYPGAILEYVPHRHETEGIRVSTPVFVAPVKNGDRPGGRPGGGRKQSTH